MLSARFIGLASMARQGLRLGASSFVQPRVAFNTQSFSASSEPKEKALPPRERFLNVYPILKKVALDHVKAHNLPERQQKYVEKMLDYNVVGGKLNRGLTVASALQSLRGSKPLTEHETFAADVCGWSTEFLQAYFLVTDDIMDHSVTRRGHPCWYRLDNVGLVSINDAFILEALIYEFLKVYFPDPAVRLKLVDLFHDMSLKTEYGQLTDLTTQVLGQPIDWNRYTIDTYKAIVKYKTSYYTFYLPVASAMIIADIKSPEAYQVAEKICLAMGEYFQVQDDFLDCYGDPEVIGKIGTDIEDGKCCWLVIQALSRASDEDKKLIQKHYGTNNAESAAIIKKLYEKLNIKQIYEDFENTSHAEITKMINEQTLIPKAVFTDLLGKIFKRSK